MPAPQNVAALKKALGKSKKIFVWAPIARMTEGGTSVGGYMLVYRPQVKGILDSFALPSSSWDSTVQCFFRLEEDTLTLYIEGFNAA